MSADGANINIKGFFTIRDKETGEVLLEKTNSIHYGNMARIVAQALINDDQAYIYYMAFGSGGTSVDTVGKVIYKSPRVSEAYEATTTLYDRTYEKQIDTTTEVIQGPSYSDIKMTCTLQFNEPASQDLFDSSTSMEGDYVFDELGIFTAPTNTLLVNPIESSTMITHVIFHPVQKSLNRVIEVIYTIRIQLN
jgi:hypothetical protein